VPLLRGNLHAHSTFSDGNFAVEDVIARYRALGHDFVAITDHDDRVTEDYWLHIPASTPEFVILPGIELDYRPLSQHVGKITADRETLYVLNHPARYNLGVAGILKRVAIIRAAGWPIEAVEVTDAGRYQAEHDVQEIALARIATDDSHWESQFGRAWVEVEAARSGDAILRAIKAGDFQLGFAPEAAGP
jgi:predicted metal-dependent phosphoesterase TrpH